MVGGAENDAILPVAVTRSSASSCAASSSSLTFGRET